MICLSWAHENRPGAKFCEQCAAPLKRVWAACGVELRPTAKFCDECGAAIAMQAAFRDPLPDVAAGSCTCAVAQLSDRRST